MYTTGEIVFAYWEAAGAYYLGTVVNSTGNSYHIVFADGDQGNIPADKIKKANLAPGLKVHAMWTDKSFYPGTIQQVTGMAAYIHFDDDDKGWTSFAGIVMK